MLSYLIAGVTLGFGAGLSPGPLLALLVSQTIRYGLREGLKVAAAPILTDAPIVAGALVAMSRLARLETVLGWISLAGGAYVIWLGIETLRARAVSVGPAAASPHSIRRAMGINFLNPHVYVFWGTVGAPTVLRAAEINVAAAAGFMTAFYVLLCGSKMVLAVAVHRSRGFLQGAAYRRTLRGLGVVLVGFGVWLIREGAVYLMR